MGKSPVSKLMILKVSKMLNVNLCLNIAVPSAKPKYVLTIDSELVA